jgi:hypothetical protein
MPVLGTDLSASVAPTDHRLIGSGAGVFDIRRNYAVPKPFRIPCHF